LYQFYSKIKQKNKVLPEVLIFKIIFQVLKGISYMHENGYFHRDLKPENILISHEQVKICDFGSVKELNCAPPFTEYTATRWYRSPEQLSAEGRYNAPVDVFAIGVIMAELYNLKPIFQGRNQEEQLKLIHMLLAKDKSQNQNFVFLHPNNITP
jgi:serine/threonine protein kinase